MEARLERLATSLPADTAGYDVREAVAELARLEAMAETVRTLEAERDRLRGALRQIDNGEGAYGMQALEYKNIARAALNPTGVGEAG